MRNTEWKIPYKTPKFEAPEYEAAMTAAYGPLLARLLAARGCGAPEKAEAFLRSDESVLSNPLLLEDMNFAVNRLQLAIDRREHVAVYGDYDVDGITASCMLTDYLREKGLACELRIPNRKDEGYGVNTGAIEELRALGVKLIITVDCGVTAVEEAAFAEACGMDIIITDHHECPEILPDAAAVVDPKRTPDGPGRDLAGVGVAFKLLCALEGNPAGILARYADLVAVGTVADVMPMQGENRFLIRRGLEKLRTDPRPGLAALVDEAKLELCRVNAANIGFSLSPRINAAGRLGEIDVATGLMLTKKLPEARELAERLCRLNEDRKVLGDAIWNAATASLKGERPKEPIVICIAMNGDTRPHPVETIHIDLDALAKDQNDKPELLKMESYLGGIAGIVASRLTEEYGVPALMICLENEESDEGKGSCRSCGGFNIHDALKYCADRDLLVRFGGHEFAAGLTIKIENIPAFREALSDYYREHPADCRAEAPEIDLCIENAEDLCARSVEKLELLEPCGTGNPRPSLCLRGAVLTDCTEFGDGKHLRMRLQKFGILFNAVFFSKSKDQLGLRPGARVDAVFYPQINEYRGHTSVQLMLSAVRDHETGAALEMLHLPPESLLSDPRLAEAAAEGESPTYADCGGVFRNLQKLDGTVTGTLREIREKLGCTGVIGPRKTVLALRILEELEHLTISVREDLITVVLSPEKTYNPFDNSTLVQQLRRLAAERETAP